MNHLIFVACLLSVGCTSMRSDNGRVSAAYVHGVVALQTSTSEKGNLWPWERTSLKKGTVVVSNACGFGRATYNLCAVDKSSNCIGSLEAMFLRGEWCDVREFTYDRPTLLILKRWNGQNYILAHIETFSGANGRPLVVDLPFIAEWDLSLMVEDLSKGEACLNVRWLSPDQLDRFTHDGNSSVSAEGLCFNQGVTVANAVKHFSNKPLQPIAPKVGAPAER